MNFGQTQAPLASSSSIIPASIPSSSAKIRVLYFLPSKLPAYASFVPEPGGSAWPPRSGHLSNSASSVCCTPPHRSRTACALSSRSGLKYPAQRKAALLIAVRPCAAVIELLPFFRPEFPYILFSAHERTKTAVAFRFPGFHAVNRLPKRNIAGDFQAPSRGSG